MLSEDIRDVLDEYFDDDSLADLYYPSMEASSRVLMGGGISCAGHSDSETLLVNYALACLKSELPDAYAVLKRVHGDGKSLRWMDSRGEGNRRTLQQQYSAGLSFVCGVVYGNHYHAEKSGVPTPLESA